MPDDETPAARSDCQSFNGHCSAVPKGSRMRTPHLQTGTHAAAEILIIEWQNIKSRTISIMEKSNNKYDFSFGYTIIYCKSMGIAAIFAGWFMYPLEHIPTPSNPGPLMVISGQLKNVSYEKQNEFTLQLHPDRMNGIPGKKYTLWSTDIPANLVRRFRPGSQIEIIAPANRPLISTGRFSLQFKIDGQIIMPLAQGMDDMRRSLMTARERAFNIFLFGLSMLLAVLSIEFRYGPRPLPPMKAAGTRPDTQAERSA